MISLVTFLAVVAPVETDEIVVTDDGSVATAIEAQRAAPVDIEIIDRAFLSRQVSSEVADAVAGLPGVALMTEGGDVRFVNIRGVRPGLGAVTLDGLPVGAPDPRQNGRQFPLDLFSTRLFKAIEVAKVPLPSATGQGIGGIVNIVSLDPFERPAPTLSVRAGAGEETAHHEVTGIAGAGNGERVGLSAGISYSADERTFGIREFRQWREFGAANIPRSLRTARVDDEAQRLNGVVSLGYAPTPRHRFIARLLGGRLDTDRMRDRYEDRVFAASGGGRQGTASAALGILGDRDAGERSLVLGSLTGMHRPRAATDLEWTVSTSRGEYRSDYLRWVFISDPVQATGRYRVDGDGHAALSGDGAALLDDLRFSFRSQEGLTLVDDMHVAEARITHEIGPRFTVTAGGRWQTRERLYDAENDLRYGAGDLFYTSIVEPALLARETAGGTYPVYDVPLSRLEDFGASSTGLYAPRVMRNQIDSTLSDYDLSETVMAGFLSGRYERGALTLLAGLRAEHTDYDATGVFLSLAGAEPRRRQSSRVDWLPSLALTWRPDDKWLARAAYAGRLARPGLHLAAPNAGLLQDGYLAQLSIGNPDLETRTADNYDLSLEYYPSRDFVIGASLFRKDIENDIIRQVDAYQGAAAARTLEDFGLTAMATVTYLEVSQPRNVQDYGLDGVEVYVSGRLGFLHEGLDDFSTTASYTAVDERGTYDRGEGPEGIRAPEQVPQQVAVTLAYNPGRLGVSSSLRWGDEYLSGIGDTALDDTRQRASGKLDVQLTYDVTDSVAVRLEATNVTDAHRREYDGIDPDYPAMIVPQPRAVFLGAEMKL